MARARSLLLAGSLLLPRKMTAKRAMAAKRIRRMTTSKTMALALARDELECSKGSDLWSDWLDGFAANLVGLKIALKR